MLPAGSVFAALGFLYVDAVSVITGTIAAVAVGFAAILRSVPRNFADDLDHPALAPSSKYAVACPYSNLLRMMIASSRSSISKACAREAHPKYLHQRKTSLCRPNFYMRLYWPQRRGDLR